MRVEGGVFYRRRDVEARIDTLLRESFWPVVRLYDGSWAVGVNQRRHRVGGRLWVTPRRPGQQARIGVRVNYETLNPVFFALPFDAPSWDVPIRGALCWLARNMPKHDVEWAAPVRV